MSLRVDCVVVGESANRGDGKRGEANAEDDEGDSSRRMDGSIVRRMTIRESCRRMRRS